MSNFEYDNGEIAIIVAYREYFIQVQATLTYKSHSCSQNIQSRF